MEIHNLPFLGSNLPGSVEAFEEEQQFKAGIFFDVYVKCTNPIPIHFGPSISRSFQLTKVIERSDSDDEWIPVPYKD